jgi:uncharacterized paraquat-inducible protein A
MSTALKNADMLFAAAVAAPPPFTLLTGVPGVGYFWLHPSLIIIVIVVFIALIIIIIILLLLLLLLYYHHHNHHYHNHHHHLYARYL